MEREVPLSVIQDQQNVRIFKYGEELLNMMTVPCVVCSHKKVCLSYSQLMGSVVEIEKALGSIHNNNMVTQMMVHVGFSCEHFEEGKATEDQS